MTPKFKVGDIIESSISSPKEVWQIRVADNLDFNSTSLNYAGELCYFLRFTGGLRTYTVYSVKAIDSDHHLVSPSMSIQSPKSDCVDYWDKPSPKYYKNDYGEWSLYENFQH